MGIVNSIIPRMKPKFIWRYILASFNFPIIKLKNISSQHQQ